MTSLVLSQSAPGGLSRRRRLGVLAICCASMVLVVMDISIVNVALPAIGRDLHVPESGLQWTVDAYTLVLASFLVLAGSTADRVGRRRVFQIGLATFGLGSLLCGFAPGIGWLIAARALQAAGGTMLNPVALAIVAATFGEPAERARAIGVFGAVSGLALALGPVIGGALVDGLGWHAIFWVNVPIAAAAIVATALFVPESRAARARRFDPVGQVLVLLVLGSVVYAIIESGSLGWTSPVILGLLAAAALGVVGIAACEPRRADPLLELRLLRSVPFSAAIVIALAALCGFGAFLFVTTQYLQDVRGMTALAAGLSLLPVGALVVALSPVTGGLVGSRGPRLPLVVAGAALAAGGAAAAWLGPATPLAAVLAVYLLFGVFLAAVNPPITNTAVAGMPRSMTGVAASLASAGRQTGTTLGVAIAGTIVGPAVARGGTAFTGAARGVWWLVLGLGLGIVALGVLSSGRWAMGTATRAAALFESVDRGRPAGQAGSRPGPNASSSSAPAPAGAAGAGAAAGCGPGSGASAGGSNGAVPVGGCAGVGTYASAAGAATSRLTCTKVTPPR
jgi:EmrB/QacA subfamily drug resistance transporter